MAYFDSENNIVHVSPDVRAHYPGWHDSATAFLANVKQGEKAISFVNFYNSEDFALHSSNIGNWEWNNKLRPDIMYGYVGNSEAFIEDNNQCYFYHGISSSPNNKLFFPQNLTNNSEISTLQNTFEIFAYAAQAWGKPIGRLSQVTGFGEYFNLQLEIGYDEHHYSHSRQFRSNIIDEWKYWHQVLRKCGIATE